HHEVVRGAEDAQHREDHHEAVRAVLHLATSDRLQDVLGAQREVQHDQEQPGVEPMCGVAGERLARARPGRGPDQDGETEGSEQVDEALHYALHRWLSTDWWERNSPKAMKLR